MAICLVPEPSVGRMRACVVGLCRGTVLKRYDVYYVNY